jgi:hypothetical protein
MLAEIRLLDQIQVDGYAADILKVSLCDRRFQDHRLKKKSSH